MSPAPVARVLVLLEGPSDVAAVRTALAGAAVGTDRLRLVDLGGVTNVGRAMRDAVARPEPPVILGMCDVAEVDVVRRALDASGQPADAFEVCDRDLEDELIRAVGPERTVELLAVHGLGRAFRTFRHQPAWRDQPLPDQLRRFAGTTSGRKELLARILAETLAPDELPRPLARLTARAAEAVGRVSRSGTAVSS